MARKIKVIAIQPDSPKYIHPFSENCTFTNLKPLTEENINNKLNLLEMAGQERADVVVTPEDITGTNYCSFLPDHGELYIAFAETIPGPITERVGEIARKYSMYIAVNLIEKSGGKYYNTNVLIGRKGEIVGKHHKVHLGLEENYYLTKGNEFSVLATDFGKVGMLICFDNTFPESAQCLALNGAELILFSTYGLCPTGEFDQNLRIRARACDYTIFFAMSLYGSNKEREEGSHPGHSCIIDLNGNVLSDAGYWANSLAMATIDLDRRRYHEWDFMHTGIEDWNAFKLLFRRPQMYKVICNENPPVMEKYKNEHFRTLEEFHKHALKEQDKYRRKT